MFKRLIQSAVVVMPEPFQRSVLQPIIEPIAERSQMSRLKKAVESAAFIMDQVRDPGSPAVFVDCGFNNGLVMQTFIDNLSQDFEYYGFEVQENLQPEAINLLERNQDRNIMLTFAALSDSEEDITYYPSRRTPWGLFPQIATTTQRNRSIGPHMDYSTKHTAPGIDFSHWLSRVFEYYREQSGRDPFIAVKMNIEGAEYPVLRKVIADGNLPKISFLMAEFHVKQFHGVEREQFEYAHHLIDKALDDADIPVMEWK